MTRIFVIVCLLCSLCRANGCGKDRMGAMTEAPVVYELQRGLESVRCWLSDRCDA